MTSSNERLGELVVLHDEVRVFGLKPIQQETPGPGRFLLDQPEVTIRREEPCTILVPLTTVSRRHARILREGGAYYLIDDGSTNGTFVDGQRLAAGQPFRLGHRNEIRLGSRLAVLRFLDANVTEVEQTAALKWSPQHRSFVLAGTPIALTALQERLLLLLFSERPGEVCSWAECVQAVWGRPFEEGDEVRLQTLVYELRQRIKQADEALGAEAAAQIESLRGKGYRYMARLH